MGKAGASRTDLILKGTEQGELPACPRMTGEMPVPPLIGEADSTGTGELTIRDPIEEIMH